MGGLALIPCAKHKSCAVCCTIFSLAAIVILLVLGFLLDRQWEYMDLHTEDFDGQEGFESCVVASIIYAVFAGLSGFAWWRHNQPNDCGSSDYELQTFSDNDRANPLLQYEHNVVPAGSGRAAV